MFDSQRDGNIIENIVKNLNEHDSSKIHNRHFDADKCKSFGLKISMMENDGDLQDAILSLHHAYMLTFDSTLAVKIIENQKGTAVVSQQTLR